MVTIKLGGELAKQSQARPKSMENITNQAKFQIRLSTNELIQRFNVPTMQKL